MFDVCCLLFGMTSKTFKERNGEHRDYPKRDVADLKGQVLEKVRSKDPFI